MKNEIDRQEKMLNDIEMQLKKIKVFLIGNIPEEMREEVKREEFLLRKLADNNATIERIKIDLDSIEEIIMGGSN